MRIVLDSNVIIAAFAARGVCAELFELCVSEHEIILCEALIVEVKKGLLKKIKVPAATVENIIELLITKTQSVTPASLDEKDCRDPKDIMVLGAAVAVGAKIIITGDKDLLALQRYRHIKIITPRDFLILLSKGIR